MRALLADREDLGFEPHRGGPRTANILVVDDEPDLIFLLRLMLETDGHRVVTAGDGVEALELVRSRDFDLIVTDLMMPRMTGQELIGEIRRMASKMRTPIVVVSAVPAPGLPVEATLLKPFRREELLAAVHRLLR